MTNEPQDFGTLSRSAADGALPFARSLAVQMRNLATAFRSGLDREALAGLADSTDQLEDLLTFLVLTADTLDEKPAKEMKSYRERIVGHLLVLQDALVDMDLVEVADTLEHDLVVALEDYDALDATVKEAVQAA